MCGSKREVHTIKICLCSYNKSKFVIICHSDLIPPTDTPAPSQKVISYFGPRKKVSAILSKKMRLGNFYTLVRMFSFTEKNIKIQSHLFFLLSTKQRLIFFFFFLPTEKRVQSFSGRIKVKT